MTDTEIKEVRIRDEIEEELTRLTEATKNLPGSSEVLRTVLHIEKLVTHCTCKIFKDRRGNYERRS